MLMNKDSKNVDLDKIVYKKLKSVVPEPEKFQRAIEVCEDGDSFGIFLTGKNLVFQFRVCPATESAQVMGCGHRDESKPDFSAILAFRQLFLSKVKESQKNSEDTE